MNTNTTDLRQNIFVYFDSIIEKGEPMYINRKGRVLKISLVPTHNEEIAKKIDKLKPQSAVTDPNDDLISCDWSDLCKPGYL